MMWENKCRTVYSIRLSTKYCVQYSIINKVLYHSTIHHTIHDIHTHISVQYIQVHVIQTHNTQRDSIRS